MAAGVQEGKKEKMRDLEKEVTSVGNWGEEGPHHVCAPNVTPTYLLLPNTGQFFQESGPSGFYLKLFSFITKERIAKQH